MPTRTRRLILLAAVMVSASACARFAASGGSSSHDSDLLRLYEFILSMLVAGWLITDPKLRKSERPSLDHGLLHMTFFPLLAVYEQFTIRRWKGIAVVLGLIVLLVAPVIAMIGL
jgi:hypothetical protein